MVYIKCLFRKGINITLGKLIYVIILCLIAISLFNNCKNVKSPETYHENEYHYLLGQMTYISETLSAVDIEIIDSLLIFLCYGDQYKFHVYNKNNLHLIGKFGMEGRGPSEYVMPIILSQKTNINDSAYLVVYDNSLRRLTYVNIIKAINNINYSPKSLYSRNRMISQISIIKSGVISRDNIFVGTSGDGRYIDGSYFRYNITNDDLSWEPFYPLPKVPLYEGNKDFLYAGYLASRPDNSKIAAASLCIEKIDILDNTGKILNTIKFENSDQQDLSDFHSSPPKGSHQYFTSITSSQDYIYALNIDQIIGDNSKQDTVTLVKVSWDNRELLPVFYKLTPRVTKIEVDEENNRIVGLSPFSSYIYYYQIGIN